MIVNNPFLGYLYNRLDFPIRFLYAHLPFLNNLFFWKLYSSDFKALDPQFKKHQAFLNIGVAKILIKRK